MGNISEYFAGWRKTAQDNLTETLSREERQELLGKLNAVDAKDAKEETKKTIGEAVALAKMEEASKMEEKWAKEKDALFREAEAAARARVESDLLLQERKIALERWNKDLERELKEDASVVHPILGPVLQDFGTKRVHAVSAKLLATLPVWKKQRIYRHNRAKSIANDKRKTPYFGMPGIIVLHEVRVWVSTASVCVPFCAETDTALDNSFLVLIHDATFSHVYLPFDDLTHLPMCIYTNL